MTQTKPAIVVYGPMRLSKEGKIALLDLLDEARGVHILPDLAHSPLVSINKLYNTRCIALFDNDSMYIEKRGVKLIMDK